MKDVYYFQHDSNARNDLRVLYLRQCLGWEGYGLYWAVLEILREQKDYKIPVAKKICLKLGLSIGDKELQAFIETCLLSGLLVEKEGFLYSESFLNRMSEIDKRRGKLSEAGRRGGIKSSQAKATLEPPLSSKEKKSKEKEKTNTMCDLDVFKIKRETVFNFEDVLSRYPNRIGKKRALASFNASVKNEKDMDDINTALNNYLFSERVKRNIIQNAATWFNNWRDWIDYKDSVSPVNEQDQLMREAGLTNDPNKRRSKNYEG